MIRRNLLRVVFFIVIMAFSANFVHADPPLPLPRVPISGDQDGSETPLVLRAPGFDLLTDVQTFRIPGEGPMDVTFDFVFREASYNNEFGFFRVDNPSGEIGGVSPGAPTYLEFALNRAMVVFPSGSTAYTPDVTKVLSGGDILVFFIVQNSTLANLMANNPANELGKSPRAFFSLDTLNPDAFDHFVGFRHLEDGILQFAFEDMTGGGDADYDDIVYNVKEVLRPSPQVEARDILFIRGLDSVGECDKANEWVTDFLSSERGRALFGQIEIRNYLNYSYAGGSYTCPRPEPAYTQIDTCDGVSTAAWGVKQVIDGQATSKVTLVGHSMGGVVAAYLVASDPDWAQSHIASVITFDSPLKGIPEIEVWAKQYISACSLESDPPSLSLLELADTSSVVSVASQAADVVPFYPLDATQFPNIIPRDRASLDNARPFLLSNWCDYRSEPGCEPPKSVDDDHSSIWARRYDEHQVHDKAFLTGCAAIGALDCTFLTGPVIQGAESVVEVFLLSGTTRVSFASNFGSIVQMTLVAPDGTVYGPDGAGPVAAYAADDVSETYEISDPAPGMWDVELFGVEVAPEGEEVALSVVVLERSGPPVLHISYLPLIASSQR